MKKEKQEYLKYAIPLYEVTIEKQKINNYGMQWDKDQKLLNPIKEKEEILHEPTDEEMMEILNPIYVY